MSLFHRLLARLPKIEVGLTDFHLSVSVGETMGESVGFTAGPHFLSFDRGGDIARQIVSPPEGYQAPLSDFSFTWNTREGLCDFFAPSIQVCNREGEERENFDMWVEQRSNPVSAPPGMRHDLARKLVEDPVFAHMWLCHENDTCPDGCDTLGNPRRVAQYQAIQVYFNAEDVPT